MKIEINPIGIIHSPFKKSGDAPIQPVFTKETEGRVEVFPEFAEGLADLEGFSHIYLIYYFHLQQEVRLKVVPFMDDQLRGVFATRAPRRPNHLGFSLVELIKIEKNILHVKGLDALDGSPLLDIKPFIARFDKRDNVKSGWQDNIKSV